MALPRTFPTLNPPPDLTGGGYYTSRQYAHDRGLAETMDRDSSLARSTIRAYRDRTGDRASDQDRDPSPSEIAASDRSACLDAIDRLSAIAREESRQARDQADQDQLAWRDQGGHDLAPWSGRACVGYSEDPDLGPPLDSAGPISGQGRCLLTHAAPSVGRMVASKGKVQGKGEAQAKRRVQAISERSRRESRLLASTKLASASTTHKS
jgi:hypothetical protein